MYSHLTPAVAAERTNDDVRRASAARRPRRRRAAPPPPAAEVEITTCQDPRVRWRDAAAPSAQRAAGA